MRLHYQNIPEAADGGGRAMEFQLGMERCMGSMSQDLDTGASAIHSLFRALDPRTLLSQYGQ